MHHSKLPTLIPQPAIGRKRAADINNNKPSIAPGPAKKAKVAQAIAHSGMPIPKQAAARPRASKAKALASAPRSRTSLPREAKSKTALLSSTSSKPTGAAKPAAVSQPQALSVRPELTSSAAPFGIPVSKMKVLRLVIDDASAGHVPGKSWLLKPAQALERLEIIRGPGPDGVRRYGQEKHNAFQAMPPFGGLTSNLQILRVDGYYIPFRMTAGRALVHLSVAHIAFCTAGAATALIALIETSAPRLERLELVGLTLEHPLTTPTSIARLALPRLRWLALRNVDTGLTMSIWSRLTATPASLVVAVEAEIPAQGPLFGDEARSFAALVAAQHAVVTLDRPQSGRISLHIRAFANATSADPIMSVVVTGRAADGDTLLQRMLESVRNVLPSHIQSLELVSFDHHPFGRAYLGIALSRSHLSTVLAAYPHLLEICLERCDPCFLQALRFTNDTRVCPLLKTLRLRGQVDAPTLSEVVYTRWGVRTLDRIIVEDCPSADTRALGHIAKNAGEMSVNGEACIPDEAT
ncbi:hypothetical protein BOTBODRAFT_30745 [Botryobasidium botryosum FD-172 SS1]|uniref:Uncharacterized protein n=1 Tax=Botryobasidium botryosum (strain FD-172 SS1) TaxID=930990 RepID=A0A067MZC6_BOTB1|nr:hypothetical protein BOTBODRAFT_30745 [Botryobasidium botryosum FD-172 SS1]